jgi:RecJ-like exonuclease
LNHALRATFLMSDAIARIALMTDDKEKGTPEAVTPGTPGSGENVCRRCEGKGKLADGGACPACNGTGKISTPIGGA